MDDKMLKAIVYLWTRDAKFDMRDGETRDYVSKTLTRLHRTDQYQFSDTGRESVCNNVVDKVLRDA